MSTPSESLNNSLGSEEHFDGSFLDLSFSFTNFTEGFDTSDSSGFGNDSFVFLDESWMSLDSKTESVDKSEDDEDANCKFIDDILWTILKWDPEFTNDIDFSTANDELEEEEDEDSDLVYLRYLFCAITV